MKQPRPKLEAPFQPEIATQGIIMVLAPVLLTTGLLLWVGWAWIEEGHITRLGQNNYELAVHGTNVMEHLGMALVESARVPSSTDVRRHNLELANKEIELCKAAGRRSELPQSILLTLERLARLCAEQVLVTKPPVLDPAAPELAEIGECKRYFYRFAAIAELSQSIHEATDIELSKQWASQDRAREQLRMAILFTFGSIVAMALLLTWRFNHSIVSRLNTLMRNTQCIGAGEHSLSPVPGRDELAYLNSALIVADGELKREEEDRKSIMEMVAHDMRSPLMASQVSLDIVQEASRDSLPEQCQHILSTARQSLSSGLQFIEDLLAIDKLESGNLELDYEIFSLKEEVDQCVQALSRQAQNRSIKLVNQCRPVMLKADRRRIGQVLTNYISNAIKFSPDNSDITIGSERAGAYHTVAVTDSGPGMDRNTCQNVFDKYYQAEEGRKKKGYGLGLAICRLLVEEHGGEVGVESEPGEGSTFWLKLPLEQSGGKRSGAEQNRIKAANLLTSESVSPGRPLIAPGQIGISAKVLGMALLPLAIQAAMLVLIGVGIAETEGLGNTARNKNRLMASLNYGALCLFAADSRLFKYALTDNPKYMKVAREDLAKCKKAMKDAHQYITDPMDRRNFDELSVKLLAEMNKIDGQNIGPSADPMARLRELLKCSNLSAVAPGLVQKSLDNMNQSSKADEVKLADSLNREASQRNFVQCAIFLFIPINIAIAALMIIGFTRGVTSRLDVLVDHARKLPKREPILWPVEGDDELAALDLILQKTCEELIECEAHRRAVMQMVAHDMRSPIMAALAGIELADTMYGEALPPLGRKQLPKAEQNIERILNLVNDLLTLDRLEAGRLELDLSTCAVRKLADEAISALSSIAARRGIALTNESEDAFISADETRLNQVLLNFISNAIKFSSDNSAISLVSKHDTNFVRIGVRDQGPGLDKKAAARVFDKFFQAEGLKKREGFGLGLAICKLIVESHGGSVSVESKPGQGCTFWMTLPYEG